MAALSTHAAMRRGTAVYFAPFDYWGDLHALDLHAARLDCYFLHIWANGYEAGYYSYLWTQMLCDDTFEWFLRHGGLTRANGQRFRDMILSRGHTEGYREMFRAFYGKDPEIGPMLQYRGLMPAGAAAQ